MINKQGGFLSGGNSRPSWSWNADLAGAEILNQRELKYKRNKGMEIAGLKVSRDDHSDHMAEKKEIQSHVGRWTR